MTITRGGLAFKLLLAISMVGGGLCGLMCEASSPADGCIIRPSTTRSDRTVTVLQPPLNMTGGRPDTSWDREGRGSGGGTTVPAARRVGRTRGRPQQKGAKGVVRDGGGGRNHPRSVASRGQDSPTTARTACTDESPNCQFWAASGECTANPRYMHQSCQKSCGKCPSSDLDSQGSGTIYIALAEDMGVTQVLENLEFYVVEEASAQRIAKSREYMRSGLRDDPKLYSGCANRHAECVSWAVAGECVRNARFMKAACAPACMSCGYQKSSVGKNIGLVYSRRGNGQ